MSWKFVSGVYVPVVFNEKYRTLPATRILPPNVNQMFPIPLFRLEIPQQVVDSAAEYRTKGYHHVLDAGTANVLEIYMAPEYFDILLCTKLAYPKVNLKPGEYDCLYLGGATLEQLKPPAGPWKKIEVTVG